MAAQKHNNGQVLRGHPGNRAVVAFLLSVAAILGLGCNDALAPTTGAIRITVSTAGADIDSDGYTLRVDGVPEQAVAVNAEMTISDLPTGNHRVGLAGLAVNCSASGANPRSVDVTADDTTVAAFSVSCVAKTGSIQVISATSGPDADPDGYAVSLDGGPSQTIAPNGALSLAGLSEGQHTILLGGVATNCTLSTPNPLTVSVTFGVTVTAAFSVACVAQRGSIRVTTVTTGADLDPDGYSANVDGDYCIYGSCHPIATNGSITISGLGAGDHTVALEGVANNCTVAGANPRTVSVTLGATTEVTFAIQCVATGSLRVTVATTGVDLDLSYGVHVQAANYGASIAVTTNGTVTFSSLLPGDYVVTIFDVAPNCDVTSLNPRTVAVGAGNPTAIAIDIACAPATQLAFVNRADGNAEIYTINSNSTNARRLTSHPASDVDPTWSPNGSKIGFASERDGNLEIYVMDPDGSNQVRLTNVTAADYRPAWSPDGARIAFVSERDGNAEIYVMNADGTSPVRLTNHSARDGDPAWSPDANKIAFRSERDGNAELYVMNADGSGLTRLTVNGFQDIQPAWSPDGARIAFSREGDIVVMNSDGSGLTQLTSGHADADTDPTWSADSRKIAFAAAYCSFSYGCESDVRVVRADGTGLVTLTSGQASNPAWRP